MRKLLGLIAASALAVGVSAPASAAPVAASGALTIIVGTLPPISIPIPSTTVDVTGGTLSVPAGMAAVSGFFAPVSGFPLGLITGIVVTASNGAGSFSSPAAADGGAANIAGGGFGGGMPVLGVVHVKGALAIDVPISVIGVGGTASASGIVVEGAPWTTGVANVTTTGAVMAMFAMPGTNMGLAPGQLTLVTTAHVNAAGLTRLPVFARLTLVTVPEPGTMLLMGAGIAGLAMISRKRISK